MSPVSGKYQAAIANFIMALLMGRSPLPKSWDLKNPDLSLLQEWHCQYFVDVKTFIRETFYIIRPHFADPNEWWLFTTQSATAVLQCLRRELLSSLDIAWYCLSKGIPFSTQIQGAPGSIPFCSCHAHSASHRSPTIGLRQCPPGYKPDARDVLLRHPHGHAALMHGGIVCHLALESVSDDAVLMGPSHDIFLEGSFLGLADGYLCNDILSEDELEV